MCKIVLNMFEILVFERCQTPGGDNETNWLTEADKNST
jgi:hypothetical protein